MRFLGKSVATDVVAGPFLNNTDGVTELSSLTLGDITCKFINGAESVTTFTLVAAAPDTGAGERLFTNLSGGYWKVSLTAGDLGVAGEARLLFTDPDVFLPVWCDFMVVSFNWYAWMAGSTSETDLAEIKNRLGAFTGTGSNNVLGILRTMCRSGHAAPSDLGGNYDPATDSLEAAANDRVAMKGSGFNTNSHSLVYIATNIPSGGAGSGAPYGAESTGTVTSGRFLSRLIWGVRRGVDDPHVNSKYSDTVLIDELSRMWSQTWDDLQMTADTPVVVRKNLSVVSGQQEYLLPPNVGQIQWIGKRESSTGLPNLDLIPRSTRNPYGAGWKLEGHLIRFTPSWRESETLVIDYVPNGDLSLHEGQVTIATGTETSVTLDDPTDGEFAGSFDGRDNAYAGYYIRIVDDSGGAQEKVDERIITAFDRSTRVATLQSALALGTGDFFYEVVPFLWRQFEVLLSLRLSRHIASREGMKDKYGLLTQEYRESLHSARIKITTMQGRRADRFEGDVVENPRYMPLVVW